MSSNTPLIAVLLAVFCLACGSESEVEPPSVGAGLGAGLPARSGASYEVSGLTEELDSGSQREISGIVVMSRSVNDVRSSFELSTTLPSPDGPLYTQVIGIGEGELDAEGVLRGTARTQLVIGSVPGVPTQFPFVPRFVGPRIVSETVTVFHDDDSIEIEIETVGAPGENYRATRTMLKGTLVPGSETSGSPLTP